MGGLIEGKAEKPTLDLLDDVCGQVLRALVLSVLARSEGGFIPVSLNDEERDEKIKPYVHLLEHNARILQHVVRQAAALSQSDVMAELDRMGVERDLLESVALKRRQ